MTAASLGSGGVFRLRPGYNVRIRHGFIISLEIVTKIYPAIIMWTTPSKSIELGTEKVMACSMEDFFSLLVREMDLRLSEQRVEKCLATIHAAYGALNSTG